MLKIKNENEITDITRRFLIVVTIFMIMIYFFNACSQSASNSNQSQFEQTTEVIVNVNETDEIEKDDESDAIVEETIDSTEEDEPQETKPSDEHILKRGYGFYEGEMDMRNITDITFTRTAPETYDEKWSANLADTDEIAGYRVGTSVFIVGDQIYFNESCGMMFCVENHYGDKCWENLREVNGLELVDTSIVTSMYLMFCGGSSFTDLNVGNWDVSNVTDMRYMFAKCTSLESLNVENWDVGNVRDFSEMFSSLTQNTGAMNLKNIEIGSWDTSSAVYMSAMFYGCGKITSLDVGNWDVSNVVDFNHMFADCYKLADIDISNWNTLNVRSFDALFNDCHGLTTIDVSNLETSMCMQFSQMFESCINLTNIVGLENWDVSNASYYAFSEMFHNCPKLTELNISTWNTSNADNMARMFKGCYGLKELDLSGFDIGKVETMAEMFDNCAWNLNVIGIEDWNLETVNIENMW